MSISAPSLVQHASSSSWLDTPVVFVRNILEIANRAFADLALALSNIRDDSNAFYKGIKLIGLGILATRLHTSNQTLLAPLASRINNNMTLLDTFSIFDDFYTLFSESHKRANIYDKISNWSFFTADVGGVVLWLDKIKALDFSKVASALGTNAKNFGGGLTALTGIGFIGMGISSFQKLKSEINAPADVISAEKKRQTAFRLAWATSQVFNNVVMLGAIAGLITISPYALIALSAFATTLGIIQFVHGRKIERQINQA